MRYIIIKMKGRYFQFLYVYGEAATISTGKEWRAVSFAIIIMRRLLLIGHLRFTGIDGTAGNNGAAENAKG